MPSGNPVLESPHGTVIDGNPDQAIRTANALAHVYASFYQEISYYHGQDSDGSWSEGGTSDTEYLSVVEPGTYVLRTTAAFASSSEEPAAIASRAFATKVRARPRYTRF